MDIWNLDAATEFDDEFIIHIIYNIVEGINKRALDANVQLLRAYKAKFKKLKKDLLDGIRALPGFIQGETFFSPTYALLTKEKEDTLVWVNMISDFYGNIVDGIEYITNKDVFYDVHMRKTARGILGKIPSTKDIKLKRGLQTKAKLIRRKVTADEFLLLIEDTLKDIDEMMLEIDKATTLGTLFLKYKLEFQRANVRLELLIPKDATEELINFGRKELATLEIETRLGPRINQSVMNISTYMKENFDYYIVTIEEVIKILVKGGGEN